MKTDISPFCLGARVALAGKMAGRYRAVKGLCACFFYVNLKMAAEMIRKIHLKSCFMHFDNVCETVFPITKARLEKFVESRKQWVNFNGEQAEICRKSYEFFSDENILDYLNEEVFELDWPYHKTCYKRICDVEKIRRAEIKSKAENSSPVEKVRAKTESEKRKSSRFVPAENVSKRPKNVLPEQCIICQRQSPWFRKDKVGIL